MMYSVKRLAQVVTMVIALLALSTSSATAQESPVEVYEEDTFNHCGSVTTCSIHVIGSSAFTAHFGGVEQVITACNEELGGEINEDGTGEFTSIAISGANCFSVECRNASGDVPWPFVLGELGGDQAHLFMEFCLFNQQGQFVFCEIEVQVDKEPVEDHHYVLDVVNQTCPSGVEFDASWEVETSQSSEIGITHVGDGAH